MTVPTQPVTVRLADFGGASVAGVRVTAKLSDFDYTVDGTFVGTETASALTDATGTAVLYVFPNQLAPDGLGTRGTTIKFSAAMPGSKSIRVDAVVPNHACDLVDILVNAEAPPFTAAQLFEQRANNAAALAEARMPHSGATPPENPVADRLWLNTTNGKTYQWYVDGDSGQWVEFAGFYYVDDPVSVAAANAERVAAETARTGAETAKTGSETARTGAETAKSGADTAKSGADAANAAAQAAKTAAEAARDAANTSARAYTSAQGTAAALADAALAVGLTFAVVAADGQSYDVYRKDAGPVATPMFSQYTQAWLDAGFDPQYGNRTGTNTTRASIADPDGFETFRVGADGSIESEALALVPASSLGVSAGLAMMDPDGFFIAPVDAAGALSKVASSPLAKLRAALMDETRNVKIVLIGDSITWGMTVTGGGLIDPRSHALTDTRNNLTSPSWANLLHKWLGARYSTGVLTNPSPGVALYTGASRVVRVTNNGLIGTNTPEWLPSAGMLPNAVAGDDEFVLVQLGTNDRATLANAGVTMQNLATICSYLSSIGKVVILMAANAVTGDYPGAGFNFGQFDVARVVAQLASAYGWGYIDNYAPTLDLQLAGTAYLSDGLHPNDTGHLQMFRAIVRRIEESL